MEVTGDSEGFKNVPGKLSSCKLASLLFDKVFVKCFLNKQQAQSESSFYFLVRMYKADKPLAQKLIKSFYPVSMDVDDIQESNQVKRAATLFDMLKELAPDRNPKG